MTTLENFIADTEQSNLMAGTCFFRTISLKQHADENKKKKACYAMQLVSMQRHSKVLLYN